MFAQPLPLKMAMQFAELAKDGKADRYPEDGRALFYRPGNQEITIYYNGLIPFGDVIKWSTSTWNIKVKEAAEKRLLSEKA